MIEKQAAELLDGRARTNMLATEIREAGTGGQILNRAGPLTLCSNARFNRRLDRLIDRRRIALFIFHPGYIRPDLIGLSQNTRMFLLDCPNRIFIQVVGNASARGFRTVGDFFQPRTQTQQGNVGTDQVHSVRLYESTIIEGCCMRWICGEQRHCQTDANNCGDGRENVTTLFMVCVSFYVPGKTSAVALQPRRIAGGKLEMDDC